MARESAVCRERKRAYRSINSTIRGDISRNIYGSRYHECINLLFMDNRAGGFRTTFLSRGGSRPARLGERSFACAIAITCARRGWIIKPGRAFKRAAPRSIEPRSVTSQRKSLLLDFCFFSFSFSLSQISLDGCLASV